MRASLFVSSSLSFVVLLAGCGRNPNVEVVGSYFPGWMVSLAAAILLTGLCHMALRRYRLVDVIGHPALMYPGMVVLFTCLLWLCFFA